MGTQFWWFYDVIAAAVILICAFLGGRKGALRSLTTVIGCAVGALLAFTMSGAMAESVYKGTIYSNNVNKLEKSLIDNTFVTDLKDYFESLDYNVKVNTDKLEEIFDSGTDIDEKLYKYVSNINAKGIKNETEFNDRLYEGYGVVLAKLIKDDVTKFAAEYAAEITQEKEVDFPALIVKLRNHDNKVEAAKEISDKYIAGAYIDIISLILFIVIMLIAEFITFIVVRTIFGKPDGSDTVMSHVIGGIFGILTGAVWVLFAAVIVRLSIIMGSNEMLFFNFEAVDQTYIFKYVYDIVLTKLQ